MEGQKNGIFGYKPVVNREGMKNSSQRCKDKKQENWKCLLLGPKTKIHISKRNLTIQGA